MEKFREILIDIALSKKFQNYQDLIYEGKKKRDLCAYFDGKYCKKYIIKGEVPAIWISNNKMNPHPLICFACPYFSMKEDNKQVVFDLFDILLYYEELRETIERELNFIENRMIGLNFPLSLKRRREDLLSLLNDIIVKIKVIKELLKISK